MERNTLQPFPAAVTLVMSDTGGYRRVNTAQDATETLLDHWPIRDGEAYLTAIQACLDAIMERVHPQAARNAFIKAAEEAGVSLLQ
ncbi:DUF982 domain-containing protein [Rhizobium sp. ICMP 5592]|nr:DUF982 domain-containing protein [Rhizobium sp. ICMP 5592]